MTVLLLTLRVLVGGVFIVSGFLKLIQPYQNFLFVIQSYEFIGGSLAQAAAIVLPWVEFFLGVFVVLGLWMRRALSGLWALSASFILLLGSALVRKLPIQECGCLGDALSLPPKQMILFDLLLLGAITALLLFRSKAARVSLDQALTRGSAPLNVLAGLVIASTIGAGIFGGAHLTSQKKSENILAKIGNEVYRRSDLSAETQGRLDEVRNSEFQILATSVEQWFENTLFSKEASAQNKSLDQYLQEEIFSKAAATDEEAQKIYPYLTVPESVPYETAVAEIKSDIQKQKIAFAKRNLAATLMEKYKARLLLKIPANFVPRPEPNALLDKYPPVNTRGAKVLVEIFSDFMCPYSARFAEATRKMKNDYGDPVRVEFRHFPLAFHAQAPLMSEAALCAEEQGRFWEFHDALYANVGGKDKTALSQTAAALGLDVASFDACVSSGKYTARVQADIEEGKKRGVSGTPTFFINGRMSVGAMPFDNIKPRLEWFLDPKGPMPSVERKNPTPDPGTPKALELTPHIFTAAELQGAPSRGPKEAPITLVEFMDFNCPYCQKAAQTLSPILEKLQGKVRVIDKQFPLPFHPNAKNVANAALCAQDQGKYWEFRDALFGEGWGKQTKEDLKTLAKTLGLKFKDFDACVDGDKHLNRVDADVALGQSLGVSGTPTFFIGDKPMVGAQSAEAFEQALR